MSRIIYSIKDELTMRFVMGQIVVLLRGLLNRLKALRHKMYQLWRDNEHHFVDVFKFSVTFLEINVFHFISFK